MAGEAAGNVGLLWGESPYSPLGGSTCGISSRGLVALAGAAALAVAGVAIVVVSAQSAGAAPAANHVTRLCSATPKHGFASCMALRHTNPVQPKSATAAPSGYGPADLQSAYALPSGGSGQTVAIVDA